MQTEKVKERFRLQRQKLGLLPSDVLTGSKGNLVTKEQVEEEIKIYDLELERGVGVNVGEDVDGVSEELDFMSEKPSPEGSKVLS